MMVIYLHLKAYPERDSHDPKGYYATLGALGFPLFHKDTKNGFKLNFARENNRELDQALS